MYQSQQLALKYFAAAIALFGIMVVAGLLASTHYVRMGFLLNTLDFSIAKILHIQAPSTVGHRTQLTIPRTSTTLPFPVLMVPAD